MMSEEEMIMDRTDEDATPKVERRLRPASLYDNLSSGEGDDEGRTKQVALLLSSTTVPQNMAKTVVSRMNNGAGRHIPTRSSLRHSRMIVLSKQGRVPRKYLPRLVKSYRMATSLLTLKLLIGLAICTVAGWLLVWAPHLPISDVHHWSGLPVIMSSVIGLILICTCKKESPGVPFTWCVFIFKLISILAALLAGIVCILAGSLSALHLARLYTAHCYPSDVLKPPCHCSIPAPVLASPDDISSEMLKQGEESSDAEPVSVTDWFDDWPHRRPWHYTYRDLNCPEVSNILTVLITATMSANLVAAALCFWYVFLHWESRYKKFYSKVQTSENHPIIITNKM